MFQGKNKAITFSYDDGAVQDIRLIELLNRYGLKATFNLNSGLLGGYNRVPQQDVAALYAGHEIAAHTLTHPDLLKLGDEAVFREVEEDRLRLSELAGYTVIGMAYPYGTSDSRVVDILRRTGVRYSRTVECTHCFTPKKEDLLRLNPTVFHLEWEQLFALGEQFVEMQSDTPQLFYIWGHSFELDRHDAWGKFETFCRLIAGHDDIFYGTNHEVLGL